MSTWGFYVPEEIGVPNEHKHMGVMLSGRVTMVSGADAWTESRSKASKKDYANHSGSGMPKRIMPTDNNVNNLMFEESDITDKGHIGECVLDNWGIEAIVYEPRTLAGKKVANQVKKLSEMYNIPLLTAKQAFGI